MEQIVPRPEEGSSSLGSALGPEWIRRGIFCGAVAGMAATAIDGQYLVRQVIQTPWVWPHALRAFWIALAVVSAAGLMIGTLVSAVVALDRRPGKHGTPYGDHQRRRMAATIAGTLVLLGFGGTIALATGLLVVDSSGVKSVIYTSAITLVLGPPWYLVFRVVSQAMFRVLSRYGLRPLFGLGSVAVVAGWAASLRWTGTPVCAVTAVILYAMVFALCWLRFPPRARSLPWVVGALTLTAVASLGFLRTPPQALTLVRLNPGTGTVILRRLPVLHPRPDTQDLRQALATRLSHPSERGSPHVIFRGAKQPAPLLDVVLVTVDAFRADRVGYMGAHPGLTPHLDGLARESLVFRNAMSNAPFTVAALSQLLTGRFEDELPLLWARNGKTTLVSPEVTTLPVILKRNGYQTRGFFTHGLLRHYATAAVGLDEAAESDAIDDDWIIDGMIAAVREPRSEPLFLWGHLMELHEPRPKLPGTSGISDNYDSWVRRLDAKVGRLLQVLRGSERWSKTVLVVTADHGESLGERGVDAHGRLLARELRIPLIARVPGVPAEVRDCPVSHIDLVPSLLSVLGIWREQTWPGLNVFQTPFPVDGKRIRPIFHELATAVAEFGATEVPWMLSYDHRFDAVTLVNLADDPDGLRNLSGTGLSVEGRLLDALAGHVARLSPGSSHAAPVGARYRANSPAVERTEAILGGRPPEPGPSTYR